MKRATRRLYGTDKKNAISIHALVKRATDGSAAPLSHLSISIHALVKRATWKGVIRLNVPDEFQSTPS